MPITFLYKTIDKLVTRVNLTEEDVRNRLSSLALINKEIDNAITNAISLQSYTDVNRWFVLIYQKDIDRFIIVARVNKRNNEELVK